MMTSLLQRMLEDMQVRNFSPHTQASYVQQVSRFARHLQQSPACLGPDEIRAYQVYLTNEKKPDSQPITPHGLRMCVCADSFRRARFVGSAGSSALRCDGQADGCE